MGTNPTRIDDAELFPLVTLLNAFPFIQTIGCCSGHGAWQAFDQPQRSTHEFGHPAYLQLHALDAEAYCVVDHMVATAYERWQARRPVDPHSDDGHGGLVRLPDVSFSLVPIAYMQEREIISVTGTASSSLEERMHKVRHGLLDAAQTQRDVKEGIMRFWADMTDAVMHYKSASTKY